MFASPSLLLVGGAKCGKSALALKWAEATGQNRLFLAPCRISDEETRLRVARHRAERGVGWELIEEPIKLYETLLKIYGEYEGSLNPPVVLLDCLSSWLANLLEDGLALPEIVACFQKLAQLVAETKIPLAIVSLEVGLGLVPMSELGRNYRELLGKCNQEMAKACSTVLLVSCGLPLCLKGRLPSVFLEQV